MLRLLSLPFAVFLGVVSFALIGAGVSMLGGLEDGRSGGSLSFGGLSLTGADEGGEGAEARAIAGGSLVGFGVLGLIAAVALGLVALSGGRADKDVVSAPTQQQHQQQQVVVVTDGPVRVEESRQR